MNIKQIGAIGGAIALILCWPFVVGHMAQLSIERSIVQLINENTRAEVIKYDRGYLSSKVKIRLSVIKKDLKDEFIAGGFPTEFTFDTSLKHGFVSIQGTSKIEELPELLMLKTDTYLSGNTDFDLMVNEWKSSELNDKASFTIASSELKGRINIDGGIKYKLRIPYLNIESLSDQSASFSDIDFEGNGKKLNSVWIGDHILKTGKINFSRDCDSAHFKWNDSRYEFSSKLDDENSRVITRHVVELNNIETEEGRVEHILFDFELGDMDSTAFDQLINFYRDGEQSKTASAVEKIKPYIEQLFSRGFYMSLNSLVVDISDKSKVNASIKLSIPEGTDGVSDNPTVVIPKLTGTASSQLTQGFSKQFPLIQQGVNQAKQNGLVSEVDDNYIIDAEINNGNLDFSTGQKLPLMSLLIPLITQ